MERPPSAGTPKDERLHAPLTPRRGRLVLFSALASVLIAAIAIALHGAGARQTFSPGAVSSPHARIDLRCAQCHTPMAGAVALRCERCHDPIGTERLELSAHVLLGTGDARKAHGAGELECAQCHTEHRGREPKLTAVADRQCVSCHFRGLGTHPNFAALQVKDPASPLRFDHDRHVVEAEKKTAASCATCHEPSPDKKGFQPIAFERHCASCHLENGVLKGSTDPMDLAWLSMPDGSPVAPRESHAPVFAPANRGRETATGFVHRDPFILANALRLRRAVDREGFDAEAAAIRARIDYLQAVASAPLPHAIGAGERDQAIAALQQELQSLDAAGSGGDDTAALNELSSAADAILKAMGGDASTVAVDADMSFEARRRMLLQLLSSIDARGGVAVRDRVDRLRRSVLALQPGSQGVDDLAIARRQRQRQLDRLLLAKEIDASPIDRLDAPPVDASLDRGDIDRQLARLQAQSDALERGPRTSAPADDTERAAQARTLASLLTACRKCHEVDAASTRMLPVRVAEPVLKRSMFNHAPHVLQAKCESCHSGIRTSKTAADVNLPAIDSCRSCHNASQVRDTCATCHRFHPGSLVTLAASLP